MFLTVESGARIPARLGVSLDKLVAIQEQMVQFGNLKDATCVAAVRNIPLDSFGIVAGELYELRNANVSNHWLRGTGCVSRASSAPWVVRPIGTNQPGQGVNRFTVDDIKRE